MGGFIGGSVESVSLSGREFGVSADVDVKLNLGGFQNEGKANGNGTKRNIKTRVLPKVEGLVLSADLDAGDFEYVQNLSDGGAEFPFSITMAGGVTYQGTVSVEGEVDYSTQNAQISLSLSGSDRLTKQ